MTDLDRPGGRAPRASPEYAWTDITYLLHKNSVCWNYYVASGDEPDCEDGEMTCDAGAAELHEARASGTSCPWFDDVKADNEVGNVLDTNDFYTNIAAGKLAAVTWLIPSAPLSEHPPNAHHDAGRRT